MSYSIYGFLFSLELPSPEETREYLLEGALFPTRPTITMSRAEDGAFDLMQIEYAHDRRPMTLRPLRGSDAEVNKGEAIDEAVAAGHPEIAEALRTSEIVLEWQVERGELDEDAWFALHLWQAWVLRPSQGWLYAPDDGLFDCELRRRSTTG